MNKQPEALRLAERLDLYSTGDEHQRDVEQAAAELRRLHEVNAKLVKALMDIYIYARKDGDIIAQHLGGIARAALAKATGENNDNT